MNRSTRICILGLACDLVLSIPAGLFGQNDEISINAFHGGAYKIRLRGESSLLSGVGGRSMALGGVASALVRDFSGAIHHPAVLAKIHRPLIYAEMLAPVGINPAAFYDVDGTVRRQVNEQLSGYNVPESALTYPQLDLHLGQSLSLGSGGAVMPLRTGALIIGYYRPLNLDLMALGNGFSTLVETSKQVGENRTLIQFAANMDMHFRLRLQSAAFSAGYGFALGSRLAAGLGIEWTQLRFTLDGLANIDGIMVLRQEGASMGTEYAFNDPFDESIRWEDGEQNDLNQSASADYKGQTWSSRLSLAYYLDRRWTVDAGLHLARTARMRGHFSFIQNLIPALNPEALLGGDGEIMNLDELNLAQPTLTKRYVNPTSDTLLIALPSNLTLGTSRRLGRSIWVVNTIFYFGELSYSFRQVRQGLKLKWSARIASEFPVPWFAGPETAVLRLLGIEVPARMQIGLGMLRADEIKQGFRYQLFPNDRTARGLTVPSLSLGKTLRLSKGWKLALVYFSTPATLLKFSLTFDLAKGTQD